MRICLKRQFGTGSDYPTTEEPEVSRVSDLSPSWSDWHYRYSTKDRVRTLEAQVAALSDLLRSVTLETLVGSLEIDWLPSRSNDGQDVQASVQAQPRACTSQSRGSPSPTIIFSETQ